MTRVLHGPRTEEELRRTCCFPCALPASGALREQHSELGAGPSSVPPCIRRQTQAVQGGRRLSLTWNE